MLAAEGGHMEVVNTLLDRGASLEPQDMVSFANLCCFL